MGMPDLRRFGAAEEAASEGFADGTVGIWSVSAPRRKSEPEAAGKPGLKGFPDDRPTVDDANHRASDVAETNQPEGGTKARRRKRQTVVLRHGGTAASTVLSTGEVVNRCVSAQRQTAELAGIGPKARPDGNTESEAFRRRRQRGPGRSLPLAKSRSNASSALRTTAKPVVVSGPDGRANPIRSTSVPRRRRPPTPPLNGDSRTEVPRHRSKPDAVRWTVREPSPKRMPAPKCLGTDEKASSESCSVGDPRNPRCLDAAEPPEPDALGPRSWLEGIARTKAFRRGGERRSPSAALFER
jgi:hypothetical protein